MSQNSEEAIALNEQLRLKMNEETLRSRLARPHRARITSEIHQLASDANKAANAYRDAAEQPLSGLVAHTNRALDAANALADAIDKLTTAIADEES